MHLRKYIYGSPWDSRCAFWEPLYCGIQSSEVCVSVYVCVCVSVCVCVLVCVCVF